MEKVAKKALVMLFPSRSDKEYDLIARSKQSRKQVATRTEAMDENVSARDTVGHKNKWVKRINWMDSRKRSQLKVAKYKDTASASAKSEATGAWRWRRCIGEALLFADPALLFWRSLFSATARNRTQAGLLLGLRVAAPQAGTWEHDSTANTLRCVFDCIQLHPATQIY